MVVNVKHGDPKYHFKAEHWTDCMFYVAIINKSKLDQICLNFLIRSPTSSLVLW